MKKILIVALAALSLSACVGLQFDNVEYDRFVTIKELSHEGYSLCGKPEVKEVVERVDRLVDHQNLYAASREFRKEVRIATSELSKIVDGLAERYSKPEAPSKTYCQEKFDSISAGTSVIMSTLGKM